MTANTSSAPETDPHVGLRPLDAAGRHALFHGARTANAFTDQPVDDDLLRDVWDLAKWPPTWANLQAMRVLFVRTPEGKERLSAHMADGNRAKTAAAPVVAVLAQDRRFHENIPTVLPIRPQMQQVLEENTDLRTRIGGFTTAMQAAYFILSVRAAGLAAGPMAGFDADALDADLFPDGRHHAELVVAIGYPATDAYRPRLPRLTGDDVLSWA